MATVTLPHAAPAPSRHLWLVAAFGLFACAIAGGYSLAMHEIQALYLGLACTACVAILIDYRIGAILLILLLPVSTTNLFPHGMMGVTGLNPINLLLGGTLVAYVLRGRMENPGALVPRPLLWLYIVPIVIAGVLGAFHVDEIHPEFVERLDHRLQRLARLPARHPDQADVHRDRRGAGGRCDGEGAQARALHRRDRHRRVPARAGRVRLHPDLRRDPGIPFLRRARARSSTRSAPTPTSLAAPSSLPTRCCCSPGGRPSTRRPRSRCSSRSACCRSASCSASRATRSSASSW
jgi:hypothetical protein